MTIVNEGIQALLDPHYDLENQRTEKPKAKIKSFSLTREDVTILESIRLRLQDKMINLSESEIIRTGLSAISTMSDETLLKHYSAITKVPSGRRPK